MSPHQRRPEWVITQAALKSTSESGRVGMLELAVRNLCAQLAELHGDNATPQRGCLIREMPLGDAYVQVEAEYEPAGGDGWNEPHYPASVNVIQVLIGGHWIDADVIDSAVIERWEQELLESVPRERAEAEGEARIQAYQDIREAA